MRRLHLLDPNPHGQPAVLLLHGLGAPGASWTLQLPALTRAGFRPIAPDAPGFGDSPYDGRGWTLPRVAQQMAALLDELATGPVHVVGLSMGGVIAQQLAHDFPRSVRSLTLVSTFAVLRPDSLSGWIYFLRRAVGVLRAGPLGQAQLVAERVFPGEENEHLRQILLETIAHADRRAYRAAMLALARFDSRRWLHTLTMPVLVVTGAKDTTVSPARQALLAQKIAGARQVIVEGAGHAVSVDQPDAFNAILLDFLRSL